MNEEKVNINVGIIKKLIELFDQNQIPAELKRFVDQSIQGKKFSTIKSVQLLKDFVSPVFNIEVINKSGPVSQYQEFISTVANTQPGLFQKEKEYTQNKIFNPMGHPMEFVKYLFPVYNDEFFYNKVVLKSKEILEECFKVDDSEIPDKNLRGILKIFDSIKKRELKGALVHLKIINNHHTLSKEDKVKVNRQIDELIQVIEEQELRRTLILNNSTEFGRDILRATNYTQSHIEQFCSYIHRLVHIKNHGNRKFKGRYYRYGSKSFWDSAFRKMCKKDLKDFKSLKSFLIRYSKDLKILRNINAHQVPKEISLSKDYKYLIFQEIRKKNKTKENFNKLRENIISYSIFINKIVLHPKSRYDPSEDTIGILKFKKNKK